MNLLFRFITFIYSFISFFERKVFIKHIGQNDLVLDIGSGDKPFWRADVIVDKYLEDDQQRHSGAIVYDSRKLFIKADVEKLPFKNKVFDFVFCSHLLEHVENPDKALLEITRVAKRGYIEVPYAIVDLFQPFPPHLWFCDYNDGALIFVQKEKEKNFVIKQTEQFGNIFFHNPLFKALLSKNYKSIFITLYWNNNLTFNVVRVKNPYKYTFKKEAKHEKILMTKLTFSIYKLIYEFMVLTNYKKKNIDLNKLLLKPFSRK